MPCLGGEPFLPVVKGRGRCLIWEESLRYPEVVVADALADYLLPEVVEVNVLATYYLLLATYY